MVEVQCPIDGCDYSGSLRSVEGHITAYEKDGHKGHHGLGYRKELIEQAENQGRHRVGDDIKKQPVIGADDLQEDVDEPEEEDVDEPEEQVGEGEVDPPAMLSDGEEGGSVGASDEGAGGAEGGFSYILVATLLFVLGAYLSGRASALNDGEAGDGAAEQSGAQDGVTTLIS